MSTTYNENEVKLEIQECDNCGYVTKVTRYRRSMRQKNIDTGQYEDVYDYFCEVCSNTFLSTATIYPNQVDKSLFKSIGWIANKILAEIKELNNNARAKDSL